MKTRRNPRLSGRSDGYAHGPGEALREFAWMKRRWVAVASWLRLVVRRYAKFGGVGEDTGVDVDFPTQLLSCNLAPAAVVR